MAEQQGVIFFSIYCASWEFEIYKSAVVLCFEYLAVKTVSGCASDGAAQFAAERLG
jgi:hypothetical protein